MPLGLGCCRLAVAMSRAGALQPSKTRDGNSHGGQYGWLQVECVCERVLMVFFFCMHDTPDCAAIGCLVPSTDFFYSVD